jgi:hypothetical protein
MFIGALRSLHYCQYVSSESYERRLLDADLRAFVISSLTPIVGTAPSEAFCKAIFDACLIPWKANGYLYLTCLFHCGYTVVELSKTALI